MHAMHYAYPYEISRDADGRFLLQFPDVPEAHTDGATEAEAMEGAADVLLAALGGFIETRRPVPLPSQARDRPVVRLNSLHAAKLALWEAVRETGEAHALLAQRLGLAETGLRRLLDLDHRSHIGAVEAVLERLGRRIVLEVQSAA
jgi:antitoxin HicB